MTDTLEPCVEHETEPLPTTAAPRPARYVAGFLFRDSGRLVCLIKKERPEWQRGKLNGVGGHIEEGETPLEAMCREFREEAGVDIEGWREFFTLSGSWGEVHFFMVHAEVTIQSMTEERVGWCSVEHLHLHDVVPNLRWLVPLALDGVTGEGRTDS